MTGVISRYFPCQVYCKPTCVYVDNGAVTANVPRCSTFIDEPQPTLSSVCDSCLSLLLRAMGTTLTTQGNYCQFLVYQHKSKLVRRISLIDYKNIMNHCYRDESKVIINHYRVLWENSVLPSSFIDLRIVHPFLI